MSITEMQQHTPWDRDIPLLSIEEAIDPKYIENQKWKTETQYSDTESDSVSSSSSRESESMDSDINTPPIYDLLDTDESDTDQRSISSAVEKDEDNGITVLSEREVERPDGKVYQYLVKCWIPQKHMDLFVELMGMS